MTNEESEDAFLNHLEDIWVPGLQAQGFKDAGKNFRRQLGEVIQVINIQGSTCGGKCFVNMGIHLTFLPNSIGSIANPATFTEPQCEFRCRLAPPGRVDCSWGYGSNDAEALNSARSLVKVYTQVGAPYLRRFSEFPKDFTQIQDPQADLKEKYPLFPGRLGGETRTLLALARIYRHIGDAARAKGFAARGLANLGRATLLEPAFRAILEEN